MVSSGGAAIATTVFGSQSLFSGGTAVATSVGSGGIQNVALGAVVSTTSVLSGGIQSNAGIASETTLDGGTQFIASGGSALATTINQGGLQALASGAVASNTQVNDGGVQAISAGATANSTTINSGGIQAVSTGAIANVTTINSGGTQAVSTGAVANDTQVNPGASLLVASGGTANRPVIDATVDALSGAAFNDTQIAAAGVLNAHGGSLIGGTTTIAGALAIIDNNEHFDALSLAGGTLQFGAIAGTADRAAPAPASFISATVNSLTGAGTLSMRTDVATLTGDFLAVGSASGNQQLLVHDYSTSAADPSQRLLLISAATGTAVFSLVNGATDVGAFQYGLANQGGNWYLFNLGTHTDTAETAQTAAQAASLIWYGELQPLYRRLGELRLNPAGDGAWARTYGESVHLTPTNAIGADITQYGVEAGIDHRFATDLGAWYIGVVGGTGWVNQTFADNTGTGTATPWSIGTYATWLSNSGWYGDFVVKYNNIDQKISTTAADGESVSASYRQNGYTLSAEGGRRFELAQRWFVEPQVELTTMHYGGASYTTNYDGTTVQVDSGNASLGRITLRAGRQFDTQWQATPLKLEPYGEVSFIRQFQGGSDVSVAGTTLNSTAPGDRGQLTLGVTAQARNLQLYTAVSYGRGQHYEQPWSFDIGLRKTW